MTVKYLAQYKYHEPSLIAFAVEKETDKTLIPTESYGTAIVGIYTHVGRRLQKGEGIFDTPAEAIGYLRKRLRYDIDATHNLITRLEKSDAQLAALVVLGE